MTDGDYILGDWTGYNTICPDCSARWYEATGSTGGWLDMVRCASCNRKGYVRGAKGADHTNRERARYHKAASLSEDRKNELARRRAQRARLQEKVVAGRRGVGDGVA